MKTRIFNDIFYRYSIESIVDRYININHSVDEQFEMTDFTATEPN